MSLSMMKYSQLLKDKVPVMSSQELQCMCWSSFDRIGKIKYHQLAFLKLLYIEELAAVTVSIISD